MAQQTVKPLRLEADRTTFMSRFNWCGDFTAGKPVGERGPVHGKGAPEGERESHREKQGGKRSQVEESPPALAWKWELSPGYRDGTRLGVGTGSAWEGTLQESPRPQGSCRSLDVWLTVHSCMSTRMGKGSSGGVGWVASAGDFPFRAGCQCKRNSPMPGADLALPTLTSVFGAVKQTKQAGPCKLCNGTGTVFQGDY
ncbi:unnamed protein product [Prunus armeniaca]|uniref:Uncharacterized protein n=1 Tax=Prunus armeniaca TaxID=36596 RepID=A0A6J5VED2_PRUAR|nr:unnamed protein product [Prunus armeniaca]